MKTLNIIILSMLINQLAFSQSINPIESTDFCPLVETTFTVTIPGTYQSIIGENGCFVTQSPYNFSTSGGNTTFNFKGKFGDANQTQDFKIDYVGGTGIYKQTFKKIKSLFHTATAGIISPNLSNIMLHVACPVISTLHLPMYLM